MDKGSEGNGAGQANADAKSVSNGATNGNGAASPGTHLHAVPAGPESRVPREQFADTITGQELADIIDELYQQRKEIESSDRFTLAETDAPTSEQLVERAVAETQEENNLGIPEALIQDIVRDIEQKLTHYIKQSMAARQDELVTKLKAHAAQLEQVAQEKVKARELQVRTHYEEAYAEREAKLRADYERLTGLANQLAKQKADIQLTRRKLAEMLQTANRVHQAVYKAGATLVSQVDHLGQIEDDSGTH